MFVLDTNVVSELRKAKSGRADSGVVRWATGIPAGAMFISSITILELELGILVVERRDAGQRSVLQAWFVDKVLPAFDGRILAVDRDVALRCARLHVPDPRAVRDALIAATALVHGMSVATRNVADFAPTGVPIVNPWDLAR